MPPNTEEGLDVSGEPPNVNAGFGPSAEPPKTEWGFKPSPPNIDVDSEPLADAVNVNVVGFVSAELPKMGIGLEPPAAPPNKDAGVDSSADLKPVLVPSNENIGVLQAGAPVGVEENTLKVVVLAGANVGLGTDVEEPPSVPTGFPKKPVDEDEFNVELPKAEAVPKGEGLTSSLEPVVVPETDTGMADFDSSATRTLDAESQSVALGGV